MTDLPQINSISSTGIEPLKMSQVRNTIIDLIAGAAGGTVSVFVGQPLDTVKVKLQTFPTYYSGMTECFLKTFRKDGIRGLYAGTVPALIANVAENAVLFAAYGSCQKAVALLFDVEKLEDLSLLQNSSSGFFAAFFSSVILCPTELVKCRLQAMRELSLERSAVLTHVTPWQLTRSILQMDGIPGLFRGFAATVSREMPGYFFFFGGYEGCRMFFTPQGKTKNDIGPFQTVLCGGIAGIIFWISVFPADVVKSRIQVSGLKIPMFKLMYQINKMEGIGALYNGLGSTVLRTFPATGALFLAYEYTKSVLHDLSD